MTPSVTLVAPLPEHHRGNIPELHELREIDALRIIIHSRLREWVAAGRTFKTLAERTGLAPATVARAAYYVTSRTHTGTIFRLAPHLGIRLDATLDKNWRP